MTALERISPVLLILAALPTRIRADGALRLTRKFLAGVQLMQPHWPGEIRVLMPPDTRLDSGNLDDLWLHPSALPFRVEVAPLGSAAMYAAIAQAQVVQGGPLYQLNQVAAFCQARGIAYVFVSEYSLRTRCQIVLAETRNPLLRARRCFWEWNQERHNRAGVRLAAAVQCNGAPTYQAYAPLNARTLLYFDNRVAKAELAERDWIVQKYQSWQPQRALRLAFSGRLSAMKGAADLLAVASALRARSVPFQLVIYGDGPLRTALAQTIAGQQLQAQVTLAGAVDFKQTLLPALQQQVDLFLCCHRQGDPACTYLETLSCGVPIVGYDNEALAGLLHQVPAGWCTPMGDVARLAAKIAELAQAPALLQTAALQGLAFATNWTEQKLFQHRTEHMWQTYAAMTEVTRA